MSDIVSVDHLTYWTNINSDIKNLLIDEFKSSENMVKLTYIISSHKEILDTAIIYMAKARLISNASGVYLDQIGEKLGVDRNSSTDDQYRAILQLRAYRVASSGTRPDIINIFSRFSGLSENNVDTYVGKSKTFDVAFYEECLNTTTALDEIVKIFPVLSSYRLIAKAGKTFKFTSVFEDSDYSSDGSNGLGSIYDLSDDDFGATYGGRLGHLIYATS